MSKPAKKSTEKSSKKSKGEASNPVAISGAPSNRRDVCIRKIDNGYVLTESGMRAGQYFQRETYSRSQPKITIGGSGKGD